MYHNRNQNNSDRDPGPQPRFNDSKAASGDLTSGPPGSTSDVFAFCKIFISVILIIAFVDLLGNLNSDYAGPRGPEFDYNQGQDSDQNGEFRCGCQCQ
jgi:hypothetical protein